MKPRETMDTKPSPPSTAAPAYELHDPAASSSSSNAAQPPTQTASPQQPVSPEDDKKAQQLKKNISSGLKSVYVLSSALFLAITTMLAWSWNGTPHILLIIDGSIVELVMFRSLFARTADLMTDIEKSRTLARQQQSLEQGTVHTLSPGDDHKGRESLNDEKEPSVWVSIGFGTAGLAIFILAGVTTGFFNYLGNAMLAINSGLLLFWVLFVLDFAVLGVGAWVIDLTERRVRQRVTGERRRAGVVRGGHTYQPLSGVDVGANA